MRNKNGNEIIYIGEDNGKEDLNVSPKVQLNFNKTLHNTSPIVALFNESI